MTDLHDTAEGRLLKLAKAILDEDVVVAVRLIEDGVPLAGKKITIPLADGSGAEIARDVRENWLSEGLSPLTWVVGRMLEHEKGEVDDGYGSGYSGGRGPHSFQLRSTMFGMPVTAAAAPRQYDSETEKSLEALSQIGGALLSAGVKADTRMGRTARSQKALEVLKIRLPEYAAAFQAAANRRRLQDIQKAVKRPEVPEEVYRPKM